MICLQHVEHPHTGQVDSKLSDAFPAFLSLLVELDDHSEKFPDLVATLKHELVKRTRCIFNPTFVSFNSIFAMSTYLDPSNRKYLGAHVNEINLSFLQQIIKKKLVKHTENLDQSQHLPKEPKVIFDRLDRLLIDSPDCQDEISR